MARRSASDPTTTALARYVLGAGAVRADGTLVDGLTGAIDELVIYDRASVGRTTSPPTTQPYRNRRRPRCRCSVCSGCWAFVAVANGERQIHVPREGQELTPIPRPGRHRLDRVLFLSD